MRSLTAIAALTFTLCACGGGSSSVAPAAPVAPAVVKVPAVGGSPWVFLTMLSPDPHVDAALYAFAPAAKYGKPIGITKGLVNPRQVATDTEGNLFVYDDPAATSSVYSFPSTIKIFAPPYTGAPKTLPVRNPGPFVLDRSNDLFLAKGTQVVEFKPPYRTVSATFSVPKSSGGLVLDSLGDVFLTAHGEVDEYSPPSYKLRNTIRVARKDCLTFVEGANSSDRLFVATYCFQRGTTITAYRITPSRLTRVHPPVKICNLVSPFAPMSPAGDVFFTTMCGVLRISPLFTIVTTLSAFGKSSGVAAVSSSGAVYLGGFGTQGSTLSISSPPYTSVEQTVSVDPQNAIYSIALGPSS